MCLPYPYVAFLEPSASYKNKIAKKPTASFFFLSGFKNILCLPITIAVLEPLSKNYQLLKPVVLYPYEELFL
jgi:hypothetical protein